MVSKLLQQVLKHKMVQTQQKFLSYVNSALGASLLVESRDGGVGFFFFSCSLLKTQADRSTTTQCIFLRPPWCQNLDGEREKLMGASHMGNFNWSSLVVAYKDKLILFRTYTHSCSLPPGPAMHSWKNSKPTGVAESSQFLQVEYQRACLGLDSTQFRPRWSGHNMTSGLFIDVGAHFQNSEFKELARACGSAIYFFRLLEACSK